MTDDEVRDVLESLERPEHPGNDVLDRVESRVAAALREARAAAEDDGLAGGDVIEIGLDRVDRSGRRRFSGAVWLTVAAAAAVVVLVASTVLRPSESDVVSDAVSSQPATALPGTVTVSTPPIAPADTNVFGYVPLESMSFELENPAGDDREFMRDRPSLISIDDNGVTSLSVRRVDGTSLVDLVVRIGPDGSATVPIEFLDPPARGGPCVGGAVRLGLDAEFDGVTDAFCDGVDREIDVKVAVLPAEDIDVQGQSLRATPVSVTAISDVTRVSTVWLGAEGVLRIDLGDGTRFVRQLPNRPQQEES